MEKKPRAPVPSPPAQAGRALLLGKPQGEVGGGQRYSCPLWGRTNPDLAPRTGTWGSEPASGFLESASISTYEEADAGEAQTTSAAFAFAAWPSLLTSRQSPRFPSGSCSFPLPCHPRGAPGLLAGRRLSSAASPGHLLKLERGALSTGDGRCQGRGRPRPLCPAEALPESPAERARETRSEHRESPGRKPGVPLDFPGT